MSDAEVMTTAIVAALHFSGNFERARGLLASPHYIPQMLSKSQFNRRLQAVRDRLLLVFRVLGEPSSTSTPRRFTSSTAFP
jgi:hypothetical protein